MPELNEYGYGCYEAQLSEAVYSDLSKAYNPDFKNDYDGCLEMTKQTNGIKGFVDILVNYDTVRTADS